MEVFILVSLVEALNAFVRPRLNIPRVLAELLVGLLFSPHAIGGIINEALNFNLFSINEYLIFLADFSLVLLLFALGIEHGLTPLRASKIHGVLGAVFGALAPYIMTYYTLRALGLGPFESSVLALSTAPTSLAVIAGIVEREHLQEAGVTKFMLTAGSLDDLVTLVMLSAVLTPLSRSLSPFNAVIQVLIWILLFTASILILPRFLNGLKLDVIPHASFAILFLLALLAALLGLSPITAAFIAGIAVGESKYGRRIGGLVRTLIAIFGSIYFIYVGLRLDIGYLFVPDTLVLGVLISILAIIGKIIGTYPFAYMTLKSKAEALIAASGMIPRGEMGLIVASLSLSNGLIGMREYGVVIIMVFITTIIGTALFKALLDKFVRITAYLGESS